MPFGALYEQGPGAGDVDGVAVFVGVTEGEGERVAVAVFVGEGVEVAVGVVDGEGAREVTFRMAQLLVSAIYKFPEASKWIISG